MFTVAHASSHFHVEESILMIDKHDTLTSLMTELKQMKNFQTIFYILLPISAILTNLKRV